MATGIRWSLRRGPEVAQKERDGMTSAELSLEEMEKYVIRYSDLPNRVSPVRLLDMALPEFERKRYPVTGRSTEQNWPDKRVGEVEAFNINFVSCEAKCGIGTHAHDSDEAFIILTGRWAVTFGEAVDHAIELEPFDMITVPPNIMHGVMNLSDSQSYMLAVQGAHRGATIQWSSKVVEAVRELGLDANAVEYPGYSAEEAS